MTAEAALAAAQRVVDGEWERAVAERLAVAHEAAERLRVAVLDLHALLEDR